MLEEGLPLRGALTIAAICLALGAGGGGIAMAQETGGQRRNHLANEASPYLQKHATNPVDWYPWGEEAFERARSEDKPIFLSIGYSTCHWCNVMEEESFSDPEVAALMNRTFVSVKVDREERPDIDALYMTVSQLLTGSGGWPLTIVMTPERKPFFAGTYFPKTTRFGRIGMMDLTGKIGGLWNGERGKVLESAEKITAGLREAALVGPGGGAIDASVLDAAFREFQGRYDSRFGGFGEGMKFPMAHVHLFLLRYWQRTGNAGALEMVASSLRAMRKGGIYDQLGYGFHRYSTDPEWLVPHFEKMLYDQALLAMAYIEAWQATGDEVFADTAREIFTYVLRDMTSPEGGFYSAESADSAGEEGTYYVWRALEIGAILGPKEVPFALSVFNIEEEGNFKDSVSGKRPGTNILHLNSLGADLAREADMSERAFDARLERVREALYLSRRMRERPLKDDKVLTDWNGLMIAALAKGGRVLDEPSYTKAAERAAGFVLDKLRSPDGGLLHRWRAGHTAYHATLDDYAFLIWGLIELSQSTYDVGFIKAAMGLDFELRKGHWDEVRGGYFTASPATSRDLIVSLKESDDSAIPSGNSVMLLNLLRLARLTGQPEYEERAERLTNAFSARIINAPSNHALFLSAEALALGPSYEVVVVGEPGARDTRNMLDAFAHAYLPNATVLFVPSGEAERAAIDGLIPFVRGMKTLKGKATAYVCRDFACNLPTESPEKALSLAGPNSRSAGAPEPK